MERFKCLAAVLALGGAHALISPSVGGAGGGFSKRTAPAAASVPIDQLREALITSKAFADLVERLEKRTDRDADSIDAAQANFGFDNPANVPPNDLAASSMAAGAPAAATTVAAAAATTVAAASERTTKLPSQQEKGVSSMAPDSPAAATTVAAASSQSAPKPPAFNLFGLGNGKKSSPPKHKSGFMKATPEELAGAQASAAKAKEEERQVLLRRVLARIKG